MSNVKKGDRVRATCGENVPDVVGTIVRDRDGDAWQRRERTWFMAGSETDSYDRNFLQGLGPLEVLWTPEP